MALVRDTFALIPVQSWQKHLRVCNFCIDMAQKAWELMDFAQEHYSLVVLL